MTNNLAVVIFDWGDTLMRDDPRETRAMVEWTQVEAIPGAREALAALEPRYRLAVATSANESGSQKVRAALARVGLDGYIAEICTARELGIGKTDPAFYPVVIATLGCQPREALMVGDHYYADVLGANAAGLRTVWFNPQLSAVPRLPPLQDGEISHMAQLPALLDGGLLPSLEQCRAWMNENGVTGRLLAHVSQVAAAAYLMAVWLRQQGEALDPLLAYRGGLLHDLDKLHSRGEGQHGKLAREYLQARGQPALAEIAGRHLITQGGDPASGPRTWEEKLVFFADKLVEQDQLAPVEARVAAVANRYPQYAEHIRASLPYVLSLQADVCRRLAIEPAALVPMLKKAISAASA